MPAANPRQARCQVPAEQVGRCSFGRRCRPSGHHIHRFRSRRSPPHRRTANRSARTRHRTQYGQAPARADSSADFFLVNVGTHPYRRSRRHVSCRHTQFRRRPHRPAPRSRGPARAAARPRRHAATRGHTTPARSPPPLSASSQSELPKTRLSTPTGMKSAPRSQACADLATSSGIPSPACP